MGKYSTVVYTHHLSFAQYRKFLKLIGLIKIEVDNRCWIYLVFFSIVSLIIVEVKDNLISSSFISREVEKINTKEEVCFIYTDDDKKKCERLIFHLQQRRQTRCDCSIATLFFISPVRLCDYNFISSVRHRLITKIPKSVWATVANGTFFVSLWPWNYQIFILT